MNDARRPMIYIVDDDEAVRAALILLAEACGWQAQAFDSAAAYLAVLPHANGSPACLVLDLQMPGMNGAELQETLCGQGRLLPTVILTAQPDSELAQRALAAGARSLVPKPFLPGDWLQAVDEALHDIGNT